MGPKAAEGKISKGLYRFVDIKQPEVKWAASVSLLLEILFIAFSLYHNFDLYQDSICSLIECIIAGLIGLIGVAIAGIAIVIALFTSEQISLIDKLKKGAFENLLYDFKWFSVVSAVETAIFIAIIFVIKSPYPIAPQVVFYVLSFLLVYGVFYLLFYACALIGNFIKMSHLKCSLDTLLNQTKSIPVTALEFQIDFLVSKLFHKDKQSAREFYNELVDCLEKSSAKNKDEILEYIKERYITNF